MSNAALNAKKKSWNRRQKKAPVAMRRQRAMKERRLRDAGFVLPLSEWLGHNQGPDLVENLSYKRHLWKAAHAKAWEEKNRDIVLLRARRAEAAGLSLEELTLEILERGRYPR